MIALIKNLLQGMISIKFFLLGTLAGALGLGVAFYFYQPSILISSELLNSIFVEEISYKFQSYAAKVSGKQSLHVARLQQKEIYERNSKAQTMGISLPDVVVSVEFPVEYNFNVSLISKWRFEKATESNQEILVVHVPEISSQSPAINVSLMSFVIKKGSILRNENEAKELLRKEINTFVIENSILLREKVRSQARDSIRQFLQNWLTQTTGREFPNKIKIYFPNEKSDVQP